MNEQLQSNLHLDSSMTCPGSLAVTCSCCSLGSHISKGWEYGRSETQNTFPHRQGQNNRFF